MGLEAKCKVVFQNETFQVRVHLDSNKLDVYTKPALHVPFTELRGVKAEGGELRMRVQGKPLVLTLGAAAERWEAKIKSPKSRLDKLGVKAGESRVVFLGAEDPEFEAELRERVGAVKRKPISDADLIFLRVNAPADLAKLRDLRARLAPKGAIWVLRQKGKTSPVRESAVRDAAREAGLVDVKVVAFSASLTADKFVIPLARR